MLCNVTLQYCYWITIANTCQIPILDLINNRDAHVVLHSSNEDWLNWTQHLPLWTMFRNVSCIHRHARLGIYFQLEIQLNLYQTNRNSAELEFYSVTENTACIDAAWIRHWERWLNWWFLNQSLRTLLELMCPESVTENTTSIAAAAWILRDNNGRCLEQRTESLLLIRLQVGKLVDDLLFATTLEARVRPHADRNS